jgi:hypothetical protein
MKTTKGSWLSKCINSVYRDDFGHHRTYDKSLPEKLFCAAVWCLAVAFCALCWFLFGEFILEIMK